MNQWFLLVGPSCECRLEWNAIVFEWFQIESSELQAASATGLLVFQVRFTLGMKNLDYSEGTERNAHTLQLSHRFRWAPFCQLEFQGCAMKLMQPKGTDSNERDSIYLC